MKWERYIFIHSRNFSWNWRKIFVFKNCFLLNSSPLREITSMLHVVDLENLSQRKGAQFLSSISHLNRVLTRASNIHKTTAANTESTILQQKKYWLKELISTWNRYLQRIFLFVCTRWNYFVFSSTCNTSTAEIGKGRNWKWMNGLDLNMPQGRGDTWAVATKWEEWLSD